MRTMRGRALVAAAALVGTLAGGGCALRDTGPPTAPIEQVTATASPAPQRIVEVRLVDRRTLEVASPSCHGAPRVDAVESSDRVELTLVATVTDPGDGCLDLALVVLAAPLGDRVVVDAVAGVELEVRDR